MTLIAADHLASTVHDALLEKNSEGNYFASTLGIHALLMSVLRNASHLSDETTVEVEKLLSVSREEFPSVVASFDRAIASLSEDTTFAAAGWMHADILGLSSVQDFQKVSPADGAQAGIPSQDVLNAWVNEKSLGIIEKFPDVDASVTLAVLANVLATDIKWTSNYDKISTPEKMSGWDVEKVLRSKGEQMGHFYALVREHQDGPLLGISAATSANTGLTVYSVIGDLPERELLRVAEKYAAEVNQFVMVRLNDLDATELPAWLTLEDVQSNPGETERYEGCLPAWDADATYEISEEKSLDALGLAVREGVLGATGTGSNPVTITQVVKASYFAEGFKAAALTTAFIGRSAVIAPKSTIRKATLFFNKPYAVVALDRKARLNVFSGVIRTAVEA